MSIRLVTSLARDDQREAARYWAALAPALAAVGLPVERVSLADWRKGRDAPAANRDLIIVQSHESGFIAEDYAAIVLAHESLMERGLRRTEGGAVQHGTEELAMAGRARSFTVACSEWAAHYSRLHTGIRSNRIIYPCVDTDTFIPSERQRSRCVKWPVVLHEPVDDYNKSDLLAKLSGELGRSCALRALDCDAKSVPEMMRGGDVWLSLSPSGGAGLRVMQAMACGLIVVGTNVGVLWPHARGVALRAGGMLAWLNADVGGIIFDWRQREYPQIVAGHVRAAWEHRKQLGRSRDYALRWWNPELFGQKWVEAIDAASREFGLEGVDGKVTAEVRAATARGPWEAER